MSDCENIRELIGHWLDGELDATASESVSAHVASCAQCREMQRQLQTMQLTLKRTLEAEAQRVDFLPFWRAVQARIGQKTSWYETTLASARELFAGYRAAWVVPITLALVLIVLSLRPYVPGWREPRNSFATVESIDSYGRNVALLRENDSKTTVIWLYEDQESENGNAEGSANPAPAF